MTVKELKEFLDSCNPDIQVVVIDRDNVVLGIESVKQVKPYSCHDEPDYPDVVEISANTISIQKVSEPLMITPQIKHEHQERINKIVERQNKRIQQAIADGMYDCIFYPDKNDAEYAEVRAIFESAGYHIKPTGYIGGVWQLSEDICW